MEHKEYYILASGWVVCKLTNLSIRATFWKHKEKMLGREYIHIQKSRLKSHLLAPTNAPLQLFPNPPMFLYFQAP